MTRPNNAVEVRERVDEIEDRESETEALTIPRVGDSDQVSIAKKYPRSLSRFLKEVKALATVDEEAAGACMYALPRSGKTIEGPSARFAEILLYSWGNARAEARVLGHDGTHIEAEGIFIDLERNVAVRKVVKRRITKKDGRTFDDDMIGVTGNAASSIALRNAIFAGIPKALWKGIYDHTRLVSLGKGGTLTQIRQKMLDYFGKLGIVPEKVFAVLGVEGLEDIKEDQCITMRGLANAIKDGEASLEETFSPRATGSVGTADLNERLLKKGANGGPKVERGDAAEPGA